MGLNIRVRVRGVDTRAALSYALLQWERRSFPDASDCHRLNKDPPSCAKTAVENRQGRIRRPTLCGRSA